MRVALVVGTDYVLTTVILGLNYRLTWSCLVETMHDGDSKCTFKCWVTLVTFAVDVSYISEGHFNPVSSEFGSECAVGGISPCHKIPYL